MKPNFLKSPPQNLAVVEGTDLEILCAVNAEPKAEFNWLKDGQPLCLCTRYSAFQLVNQSKLHIKSADVRDSGEYTCVAKNSSGESQVSTLLSVKETNSVADNNSNFSLFSNNPFKSFFKTLYRQSSFFSRSTENPPSPNKDLSNSLAFDSQSPKVIVTDDLPQEGCSSGRSNDSGNHSASSSIVVPMSHLKIDSPDGIMEESISSSQTSGKSEHVNPFEYWRKKEADAKAKLNKIYVPGPQPRLHQLNIQLKNPNRSSTLKSDTTDEDRESFQTVDEADIDYFENDDLFDNQDTSSQNDNTMFQSTLSTFSNEDKKISTAVTSHSAHSLEEININSSAGEADSPMVAVCGFMADSHLVAVSEKPKILGPLPDIEKPKEQNLIKQSSEELPTLKTKEKNCNHSGNFFVRRSDQKRAMSTTVIEMTGELQVADKQETGDSHLSLSSGENTTSKSVVPLGSQFNWSTTNCYSFPKREVEIQKNINPKEMFEWYEEIGSGKFGKVYKCREKETNLILAGKYIRYRRSDRDDVVREVEIMKKISHHPQVMNLHSVYDIGREIILIMEYVAGGELFERIAEENQLTEHQAAGFVRQILSGLEFIHSNKIIHRDLKPENILCKSKDSFDIKIIDFGLADFYDSNKPPKKIAGTTLFIAPEVIQFEPQSYKTDIWSLGVITYDLLAGITPFEIAADGDYDKQLTDNEILVNIEKCQYTFDDEGFDNTSELAKDFIRKILVKRPEKRPSAAECLNHEWFKQQKNEENLNISIQRMKKFIASRAWHDIQAMYGKLRRYNSHYEFAVNYDLYQI